ncbi:MAG: transcriptional repressor [Spirochaetales bacterium]|nr:transcriptional repressor [Spirochaetales bacterium]
MEKEELVFKNYLVSHGLKYTPERKIVFDAIISFSGHFDADTLYESIRRNKGKLSRATVYRALPHFIATGIVKESLRFEGRTHYEKSLGTEHHDHLVCLGCGKIIEFKDEKIEELQNKVCKKYSFKALDHKLGIRGYCKTCQKK